MAMTIGGLMPILATPFCGDGDLDCESLRRLVEFELVSGVDGLAVFGMASEGFALTADERRTILREVTNVVAGPVPVIAGINGTSTVGAIEQADEARSGGADALMVLPPFMVKPPPGSLVEFYSEVAAATSLPIMVQDAPGVTGVTMSPEVIATLSRIDRVESVKIESPPTAPKVGAVVQAVNDNSFAVLGGQNSQFCLEEYARGAVGTMPACEFPDLLQPVLALWRSGEELSARNEFSRLLPLILLGLQPGIAWAVHKEVLVARGIIENSRVRYPASPMDGGTLTAIAAVLGALPIEIAAQV